LAGSRALAGLLALVAVAALFTTGYQFFNPAVHTTTRTLPGTTISTTSTSVSTTSIIQTTVVTTRLTETGQALIVGVTVTVTKVSVTHVAQSQTQYQPTCQYPYSQNGCTPPPCPYPFNPATCNEGPPVTVAGQLTSNGPGSCTFLYLDGMSNGPQNYVLYNVTVGSWNNKLVQVFGYAYPNWPGTQPFPPYQFPYNETCVGTPFWVLKGPASPY